MNKNTETNQNRRDFIKKAAYIAPAVLTIAAVPAFASSGSGYTQPPAPPRVTSISGSPGVHRERKKTS